ncbi:MAG: FkbM family methyltransferase [Ignavibacteriae bacterium]|nr:FkbM family methyltransferase [Ignavibacteriota bacterium]
MIDSVSDYWYIHKNIFHKQIEYALYLNKHLLKPIEYPNLVRLGEKGDGGYVIPGDQITECDVVVSLGLSDDWSFDKEYRMKNPAVKIIGVDHSIGRWWFLRRILIYAWKVFLYGLLFNGEKRKKYLQRIHRYKEYFTFFQRPNIHIRKRVSTLRNATDIRLSDIVDMCPEKKSGHDIFLKMDIEGSEYEIAQDIVNAQHRIRCIAGEFHDLDTRTKEFNECMLGLTKHFYVVHIHGNNGATYDVQNDFPSVVEITFINKNVVGNDCSHSTALLPREGLDYPNNPAVPDYSIRFG